MRRFFEVPVRSIIPLPQVAHTASPVRRMGPVVTRGATTLGLRACSCRWTRENTSRSIIAGTETSTISPSLRRFSAISPAMRERQQPFKMTFAGSNPLCPARQCGLSYSISGCAGTADIHAGYAGAPESLTGKFRTLGSGLVALRRQSPLTIFQFPFRHARDPSHSAMPRRVYFLGDGGGGTSTGGAPPSAI
jgi:hypothetical protein